MVKVMLHVNSRYRKLCIKELLRGSALRKRTGKHYWRGPLSVKIYKGECNFTKSGPYKRWSLKSPPKHPKQLSTTPALEGYFSVPIDKILEFQTLVLQTAKRSSVIRETRLRRDLRFLD